MSDLVLLTGISGFIAKHVALDLLGAGYRVRGTVRSSAKADVVRETLKKAGGAVDRLEFFEADLTRGGRRTILATEAAEQALGIDFRPPRDAVAAMVRSLKELDLAN